MKRERYFRDELWRMFAIYAILPAALFTFFCGILFMAVLLHGRDVYKRQHHNRSAGGHYPVHYIHRS